MSREKIRHLVRKGAALQPRWYWQPSPSLTRQGWPTRRLALAAATPAQARGQAIAEAEALNARVDAWRAAGRPPALLAAVHGPAAARPPAAPAGAASGPLTVAELIDRYQAAPAFLELRDSSRRMYRDNLRFIRHWATDPGNGQALPLAALHRGMVEELYAALRARTPAKANSVVRVMRLLFGYAVRRQWLAANPAEKPGIRALGYSGHLWTPVEIACIVATADRLGLHSIGTAVRLNAWLGQREGDILALPRPSYADGVIRIQQSKTGARVAAQVDAVPTLRRRLADELARQQQRGHAGVTLLLCESTGQPWQSSWFQQRFRRVKRAAAARHRACGRTALAEALEALQFKHLRHTVVMRLAHRGLTDRQVAELTGHRSGNVSAILEHYWQPSPEGATAALKSLMRGR